ncbi:MAG: phosphoribosylanthranilate isomerase [Actinomycetota bacterium]|nr:phosphoribosylanthranilate isomerase [Actinomycetota bacterium]
MNKLMIQIYTMQSVAEAVAIAELGVDHVGMTPADRGLPGEITPSLAFEICRAVDGLATSVALSVDTDLAQIEQMVKSVQPDILHLCGPTGAVGPDAVVQLRRRLPDIRVMQAIAVTGPEAITMASLYAPLVDFLLLDSVDPNIEGVGAAGIVHDWNLSAEIVQAVDVPVILAGGLSPSNVRDAIAAVAPWGVDSLTHTNLPLVGGGFRKDLQLVARFESEARGGGGA